MRKLYFWRADWFLGVLVALDVPALSGRNLIQRLGRKACDPGKQAAASAPPAPATPAASALVTTP